MLQVDPMSMLQLVLLVAYRTYLVLVPTAPAKQRKCAITVGHLAADGDVHTHDLFLYYTLRNFCRINCSSRIKEYCTVAR
jgi:hypothetical protein